MGVAYRYTPPDRDAAALLRTAAGEAVNVAADTILEASQQLVPVDTGALKASGHVVREEGARAAVVYGAEDGAGRNGQDTAAYAVVQHERLDFEHPHGQAKFLETVLHSEAEHVAEVVVAALRRAMP